MVGNYSASLALATKDLRVHLRGWRWAAIITLYVAILALTAFGFLLHGYNPSPDASTRAGVRLFQTLALVQLFLLVFVVPASLAGAIAGERQHQTWDNLAGSYLSSWDIVGAKFLAGITFNLLLVAASLPLFGLVFLFGGASLGDVLPAFAVFLATILLLGTASLAVSVLSSRLTVAILVSLLVALALAVGLTCLAVYLQAPGEPSALTLASLPFQSYNTPVPLSPLSQVDPVVALLSTLPAESGGTLLGDLGIVHHAFGLPWQLPLWGAYALLSAVLSLALLALATVLIRPRAPRAGPL